MFKVYDHNIKLLEYLLAKVKIWESRKIFTAEIYIYVYIYTHKILQTECALAFFINAFKRANLVC